MSESIEKVAGGAKNGTVLVTGGAGYIGSHACKALAAAGYLPVTLDNLVYGHSEAVKWGPFVQGDISERGVLDKLFEQYKPLAVMHFAAYAYVGESVLDPGKYYRNNVAGTLTLLEAMRDHGIAAIIFSSTCATYGNPVTLPITEDHPQNPINPYGASKLMVERMLDDFGKAHGVKSVALRYFNASGADPEIETGESHNPETHLIPMVLDVALGKRLKASIFGTDYDTADGTCVRDYIHVTDLADAHVQALGYLLDGGASTAFNLGNGEGFSVLQVIDAVCRVTGRPIPTEALTRREGDPSALEGGADKARQLLNWKPQFSDLDAIIKTAWQWHLKINGN